MYFPCSEYLFLTKICNIYSLNEVIALNQHIALILNFFFIEHEISFSFFFGLKCDRSILIDEKKYKTEHKGYAKEKQPITVASKIPREHKKEKRKNRKYKSKQTGINT